MAPARIHLKSVLEETVSADTISVIYPHGKSHNSSENFDFAYTDQRLGGF